MVIRGGPVPERLGAGPPNRSEGQITWMSIGVNACSAWPLARGRGVPDSSDGTLRTRAWRRWTHRTRVDGSTLVAHWPVRAS